MIYTGKYAASNFVVRKGIELDADKGCYRLSYRILGLFTFRSPCEKIPKGDYILLFKTLYAKCEPCGLDDFDDSAMIQLSLVYRKNRRLILHEGIGMSDMRARAREFAAEFNLRIRDSATDRRNPVWLK